MKRFAELPVKHCYTYHDDITGNLKAGDIFVGEIFETASRTIPVATGTFMVIASNGRQQCMNLLTGLHYPNACYVRINLDVEPSLELK